MKTIALFGASGKTGTEFLKLALDKGYNIKALVRSPDKFKWKSPRLTVIQGDVLNARDVQKTVEGTDGVVSLFGHVKGSPELLQTNGTQNIIAAMKQEGIRKIISLSGGGLPFHEDKPKVPDHLIRLFFSLSSLKQFIFRVTRSYHHNHYSFP
jgi:putative NADH-flavin reductase